MNEITRFPPRLRLVGTSIPPADNMMTARPRYAGFLLARTVMFERLREMAGSDELTMADLNDEIDATASVMRSLVTLDRTHT